MPAEKKPHAFVDHVLKTCNIKSDYALCVAMGMYKSVLSKIRHGVNPVSAEVIVAVHEVTGIPIKELKALADKCNARLGR